MTESMTPPGPTLVVVRREGEGGIDVLRATVNDASDGEVVSLIVFGGIAQAEEYAESIGRHLADGWRAVEVRLNDLRVICEEFGATHLTLTLGAEREAGHYGGRLRWSLHSRAFGNAKRRKERRTSDGPTKGRGPRGRDLDPHRGGRDDAAAGRAGPPGQ